jgi:hypothetical protein
MSITVLGQLSRQQPARPVRRVRHEVRDGAVVVAFSAVASTGTALALFLLVRLAG